MRYRVELNGYATETWVVEADSPEEAISKIETEDDDAELTGLDAWMDRDLDSYIFDDTTGDLITD